MTAISVIRNKATEIIGASPSRIEQREGLSLVRSLHAGIGIWKVSLALVLIVFTGLVMSGTSLGERLDPGTVIGLFAAVAVSGIFVFDHR